MRGLAPASMSLGAIPYLKKSYTVEIKGFEDYLPRSACAKVDSDDVRVLRIFFQKCHLNLNLILAEKIEGTLFVINNISIILKRAIQDVDVSGKFFISD